MDEERDIIVFEDESGNEIEYEIEFTFEHKDGEYAVLSEVTDHELGDDEVPELYILKIVKKENGDEEFIAADEDMMDELIEVVESIFAEELDGEDGCGCDCESCHGCTEDK